MYTVYALRSETTNKIYIGQTSNLVKRLDSHNKKTRYKKGSYTDKNKGPWVLTYKEIYPTRKEAKVREKQLKSYRGRQFIKNLGS